MLQLALKFGTAKIRPNGIARARTRNACISLKQDKSHRDLIANEVVHMRDVNRSGKLFVAQECDAVNQCTTNLCASPDSFAAKIIFRIASYRERSGWILRFLFFFCFFYREERAFRRRSANESSKSCAQPRHGYLEDGEFGSDIPFATCSDVTRMPIAQGTFVRAECLI